MSATLRIHRAVTRDLGDLARLFDSYRQFYEQVPDAEGAAGFLRQRLSTGDSALFIARDSAGRALGFTQLYPAICSVAMRPYWVLYDLFVDRSCRRAGVGRALMERAREHGLATGAARIELETAHDNLAGQALYESLGYVMDRRFAKYSLDL